MEQKFIWKCRFMEKAMLYDLLWKITRIRKLWDRFQNLFISVAFWKLLNYPCFLVWWLLTNNFTEALKQVLYIVPKMSRILVDKNFPHLYKNVKFHTLPKNYFPPYFDLNFNLFLAILNKHKGKYLTFRLHTVFLIPFSWQNGRHPVHFWYSCAT